MNDQKNPSQQQGGPSADRGGKTTGPSSPNQQRPPTDNERKSGSEQGDKARRSNLAGDQDTDEPVETEEGKSAAEGHA